MKNEPWCWRTSMVSEKVSSDSLFFESKRHVIQAIQLTLYLEFQLAFGKVPSSRAVKQKS